jgi:hypothetical protein
MTFRLSLFLAAAAVLAGVQSPALAQDVSADPNFGTVNLRSGFTPDPRVVSVQSGGDIDAETIDPSCRGFISNAPDVRLYYDAGSLPLIISVASSADTTLVINGPDGRWYCDDDGGVYGLNPMVRFDDPGSGRYEIWVGTYGSTANEGALLHISEISSR